MRNLVFACAAAIGAAVVVGCCCLRTDEEIRLAKDGQALARIVIAKDATKAARFGAADLKWHLDKITGGNFEIVTDDQVSQPSQLLINVGPTKFVRNADVKGQQYRVDIRPDGIDLVGEDADDRGAFKFALDAEGRVTEAADWPPIYRRLSTTYAVYEFLENVLGVRWVDPSDYGTVLPSDANLSVPCRTIVGEPFLRYRGGTPIDHLGSYGSHLHRKTDCYKLEYALYTGKNGDHLRRHQEQLFLLRHRVGGEQGEANHSFYGWYNRFWKQNEKCPWVFEGAHPDWFAKGYGDQPPQLCYSNPEVVDQAVRDVCDYFRNGGYPVRDKKGEIVRRDPKWGTENCCLEPMDNSSFCQCERCRAQAEPDRRAKCSEFSTYWFRFVKTVAERVQEEWPDKRITTLAYGSHEGLPTGLTLPKNVVVYFCLSENRTLLGRTLEECGQFKRMAEWRAAYPDQPLAMWLYNTFPDEHYRAGGYKGVPGFFSRDAEAQYRFFRKLNVRGGLFHCGMNGELDNYMQLEWMVNPDRTAEEMKDEYFGAYGQTGAYLRKFYDLVERRYCGKGNHKPGRSLGLESCWKYMIRPCDWEELTALIDQAEAAAETPAQKCCAKVWRIAVYDYMKEGHDVWTKLESSPAPEWTAGRIASAGGDLAKVPWEKVTPVETPTFWHGSGSNTPIRATLRLAHDGAWLYFEETQFLDTAKLHNEPTIFCFDEVEVLLACQQGSPYRVWFSGPNGNSYASSFHEVNWRWNVSSQEHGNPLFGAKYASDVSKPDRWTFRWAFPLKTMLNREIRPGDDVYLNATTILGPHYRKDYPKAVNDQRFLFLTLTSHTSVHSPDRTATVHLEK